MRIKRSTLNTVLTFFVLAVGIFSLSQYISFRRQRIYLDNLYQKSFYELVDHVSNMESNMSKLMVSEDNGQNLLLLTDIWMHAGSAEEDLSELPVGHLSLLKTSKFINQLGDYCYYLTKKAGDLKVLSIDDMENIAKLHNSCSNLNTDLRKLGEQLNSGGVSWGEISQKANKGLGKASKDVNTNEFTRIEQRSIDYPTLIYDGPFSETLINKKHEVKGRAISKAEAGKIAKTFIGEGRVESIDNAPDSSGDIETWGIYVNLKDNKGRIFVSVTKKGGKVISMMSNVGRQQVKLSPEQVLDKAEEFLKKHGYGDMVTAYQQYYNGTAIINFVRKQDEVLVYPELIKVKASMEDGSVFGFEARNYILSKKDRDIKEPKLSMDQARDYVSKNLDIKNEKLVIIPTDAGGERLCYEFKGNFKKDVFIVYIDANTGEEADILKVIDSQNGTLVI